MRKINKEDLERVCFNCVHFHCLLSVFPDGTHGICLNRPEFEPFVEELLEEEDVSRCRQLVLQGKIDGNEHVCDDFEATELFELDDAESEVIRGALREKDGNKKPDPEKIKNLLQGEAAWAEIKTGPPDAYISRLNGNNPRERREALETLKAMIALGNRGAFKALAGYLRDLPPPEALPEVHFRIRALQALAAKGSRPELIPQLVAELYRTPSNNTTRQWITAVFDYLARCPAEKIRRPLTAMLKDKRFSHRLKLKIRHILERARERDCLS